jgi:PAS domain S-box-containing protein
VPAQHPERSAGAVPRWKRPAGGASPLRIVLLYLAVGIAWIAFSDQAVDLLVPDPGLHHAVQTVKGALYVLVTAALLYHLIGRGEKGLRALGSELRSTIESMEDGVLVVDQRTRIVEANRAALELLGVSSKEELLGPLQEWGRRFELRDADGTLVPLERYATVRALAGERVPAYDAILRRADGRDVWIGISAAPVATSGRRPRLAVAILRDVSETKRVEAMRDEFLASAAHELKTPLAVIKAYAQLVQKRAPGEAAALSVVDRQVDRMNRLVEHLLDLSRLESGGPELRAERFDLARLAAEAAESLRKQAPRHTIRVDGGGDVPVVADRDRIGRVMTSLLDNAVRYSPDGGSIEASVERSGGEAVFTVRDRGLGIAPERQARVFERFYRAHAGAPEDPGGLGVALGLSREIVARHGGRMWFESEPGRGSTFHFSLPLAGGAE